MIDGSMKRLRITVKEAALCVSLCVVYVKCQTSRILGFIHLSLLIDLPLTSLLIAAFLRGGLGHDLKVQMNDVDSKLSPYIVLPRKTWLSGIM